ncbi:MAG: hypothetical protein D6680_13780 [Cyanobacteria bacterium J007]|nr:MAG: hypothetical protein D6680_13780 [Cyanobacteria bacterium J007]
MVDNIPSSFNKFEVKGEDGATRKGASGTVKLGNDWGVLPLNSDRPKKNLHLKITREDWRR